MIRGIHLFLLAAVLLSVVAFNVRLRADAADAQGCAGLATYRDAMVKIERDYLTGVTGRDLFAPYALTAADFRLIGEQTSIEIAALKAVTPPAFVQGWHEAYLARVELRQQMALAAAQRGVYAMSLLKGADDYAAHEIDVTVKAASASCGDFAAFIRELNSLSASAHGTPIATPAS